MAPELLELLAAHRRLARAARAAANDPTALSADDLAALLTAAADRLEALTRGVENREAVIAGQRNVVARLTAPALVDGPSPRSAAPAPGVVPEMPAVALDEIDERHRVRLREHLRFRHGHDTADDTPVGELAEWHLAAHHGVIDHPGTDLDTAAPPASHSAAGDRVSDSVAPWD